MEPAEAGGPVPATEPLDVHRLHALTDAVVAVSTELDTATVLARLVEAACRITGARYGALGVLGEHGGLREFVTHGVPDETRRRIGPLPAGRGVLGHLVTSPHAVRLHDLTRHPSSVGFPPHHPPMRSFLGVPVRARGEVFGNLYLTDRAGPGGEVVDFTSGDEQVVVALAAAAGVAIDHARTYRAVREHERWLEAAATCTRLVRAGGEHDATEAVLGCVRSAAGADAAAMVTSPAQLPGHLQAAAAGPHPVLVRTRDGRCAGVDGPAWLLVVPLRSGERRLGAVIVAWRCEDGAAAPGADLGVVAGFGEQLALALDVTAAQADRARLAVLEERERIARDLHDMVIQRIFAIGLSVRCVAQDAERPDVARPDVARTDVAARLDEAVDGLDATIQEIRASIFRLGSRSRSETFGLRHRIDAEVVQAREQLGFLPRLRTEGVTAVVPTDVGQDAVAVVREALANTARHALARSAAVDVRVGRDLVVQVEDDGVGVPGATGRRSGLANLAERAQWRGGRLTVSARAGGGTVLTWSVPLVGHDVAVVPDEDRAGGRQAASTS
ncbi:GAF domain-containing sensor histidine kinase [Cellulomonas cellasea]|uniref:Signal transduction histidine kinase n=1 Tax=Cellulomonas cellasea TaxID=43670 RepID=A0A7W4UDR0_9CELL|nr:GAF domain-containing sensor histidine kinase [Cellulomonas cellasea]MBB2921678.1 signal transduction histidine kinase [Cellulomonas cellasea]